MGLFVRSTEVGPEAPLYNISRQYTRLVVGLGNVGRKFERTRHNIGFDTLEHFARENDFDPWVEKSDLSVHITTKNLGDTRVILIKPTTMMNLSGQAVQKTTHFYKISVGDTLVLHDELDIDLGQIRTRLGGGSAGHNGIKSLIENIGEGFGRVRIGIGPKVPEQIDSADFVLQQFTKDEQAILPHLYAEISSIISEYIYSSQLNSETRNVINT